MTHAYKNLGIGLLVASTLLLLTGFLNVLLALIFFPAFYAELTKLVMINGLYSQIAFWITMALDAILTLAGLAIAIKLIRTNAYTKSLLYWIYYWCAIGIISFIMYLPLKQYMIVNLVLSILLYYFLIKRDNDWSRLIKGRN